LPLSGFWNGVFGVFKVVSGNKSGRAFGQQPLAISVHGVFSLLWQ
jgi:hypothetical protein